MDNFIFTQDWCHAAQLIFSWAIHVAIFKTVPTQSLIQSPAFAAIHREWLKVNMSKLETSSHSPSTHCISRECAFFLSTAASKTAHWQDHTLLNSHVGPWIPTCIVLNFWIMNFSFPCCWPSCQPQWHSRAHSSTKGSRDVNLLPKRPFTLIHGQTKSWREEVFGRHTTGWATITLLLFCCVGRGKRHWSAFNVL